MLFFTCKLVAFVLYFLLRIQSIEVYFVIESGRKSNRSLLGVIAFLFVIAVLAVISFFLVYNHNVKVILQSDRYVDHTVDLDGYLSSQSFWYQDIAGQASIVELMNVFSCDYDVALDLLLDIQIKTGEAKQSVGAFWIQDISYDVSSHEISFVGFDEDVWFGHVDGYVSDSGVVYYHVVDITWS
jgi:hypothetical protein